MAGLAGGGGGAGETVVWTGDAGSITLEVMAILAGVALVQLGRAVFTGRNSADHTSLSPVVFVACNAAKTGC